MKTSKSSRIMALVLSVVMLLGMPVSAAAAEGCTHEHDELCGYIEGVPCGHVHDEACGGLSPDDSGCAIAAFNSLDEEILYQGYDYGTVTSQDELTLPDTLTGWDADGNPVIIEGVTWRCDPAFDPAVSAWYYFSPALPEDCILAEEVTSPVISVFIRPEGEVSPEPFTSAPELVDVINSFDHGGSGTLEAVRSGDTVTVTGSVSGAANTLSLNIDWNVTVVWKADYSGTANEVITTSGNGTFEVPDGGAVTALGDGSTAIYARGSYTYIDVSGGTVTAANGTAINVEYGQVTVSGGTVSAADGTAINASGSYAYIEVCGGTVSVTNGTAIRGAAGASAYIEVRSGTVTATAGTAISSVFGYVAVYESGAVTANGDNGNAISTTNANVYAEDDAKVEAAGADGRAISIGNGAVTVSGGTVTAGGSGGYAIYITGYGVAAYLSGACGGGLYAEDSKGIIVEVDTLTVTQSYHETDNGLTVKAGTGSAKWEIYDPWPQIMFTLSNGTEYLSWGSLYTSPTELVDIINGFDPGNGGAASGQLSASLSGGVITVTGSVSGAMNILWLNIPEGLTVRWQADYSSIAYIALEVVGKGALEMTDGGKVENTGTESYSYAIYAEYGNVMVSGGTVTASGNYSRAIYSRYGDVTVSSGTVIASGEYGMAIDTDSGNVTVSGGKVTATMGEAIYSYEGNVIVSGGEVEETGGYGNAIYANYGDVTVSGGMVTAVGSDVIYSYEGNVIVSGGEVKASGEYTEAIYADYGNVMISGGKVTASGGDAVYSYEGNVTVSGSARVEATGYYGWAIYTYYGDVMVSGGEVKAAGQYGYAVNTSYGDVTVHGGTVSATGESGMGIGTDSGSIMISGGTVTASGDYSTGAGTWSGSITVSGGSVSATGEDGMSVVADTGSVTVIAGTVTASGDNGVALGTGSGGIVVRGGAVTATGLDSAAIYIVNYGVAAYLAGTCGGGFIVPAGGMLYSVGDEYYGMIVEVESLSIPQAYHDTSDGLTTVAGGISAVWDTSVAPAEIVFTLYGDVIKSLPWGSVPGAPQGFTATAGNEQVTLSWGAPASDGGAAITRYEVSCDNGATWVTASGNTSHTFTGLTNGISYTFMVRAVNSIGAGAAATATATPTSNGNQGSGTPTATTPSGTTSSESTTEIGGNTVTTPAGQPPVTNSDGSVTLPGGGTVETEGGTIVEAPKGTTISEDGTVTIPSGEEAEVTLPGDVSVTVPGGTTIGRDGTVTVGSGGSAEIILPGDTALTVSEGTTISAGGTVTVGDGGASVLFGGGAGISIEGGTVIILDEDAPLGYYVAFDNPFTDVNETDWFYDDVAFVYAHGLFKGTAATQFSPNAPMTRAMFATVLARLDSADLSGYTSSRFSDVPAGEWYSAAVEWAADKGIVNGVGGGRFDPNANITREQMAVMLWGYIEYKGYTLPSAETDAFNDESSISTWAFAAVKATQAAGIINGKPVNLFDPQGQATRAEVSTLIYRFIVMIAG